MRLKNSFTKKLYIRLKIKTHAQCYNTPGFKAQDFQNKYPYFLISPPS